MNFLSLKTTKMPNGQKKSINGLVIRLIKIKIAKLNVNLQENKFALKFVK